MEAATSAQVARATKVGSLLGLAMATGVVVGPANVEAAESAQVRRARVAVRAMWVMVTAEAMMVDLGLCSATMAEAMGAEMMEAAVVTVAAMVGMVPQ